MVQTNLSHLTPDQRHHLLALLTSRLVHRGLMATARSRHVIMRPDTQSDSSRRQTDCWHCSDVTGRATPAPLAAAVRDL